MFSVAKTIKLLTARKICTFGNVIEFGETYDDELLCLIITLNFSE